MKVETKKKKRKKSQKFEHKIRSLSGKKREQSQLSFPPPSCVTSRGKHGSPDKSTIINTIAPSPSSTPSPPSPSSSPRADPRRIFATRGRTSIVSFYRDASNRVAPFQPSTNPSLPFTLAYGLFITTWPGFSRKLVTASLLEKGGEGEGGRQRARGIVDGSFVEWQNVACNFTNIQHVAANEAWLAAWFTLRLCSWGWFARRLSRRSMNLHGEMGRWVTLPMVQKGELDLNELKGAWQSWRGVLPRWCVCNGGMVLLEQVEGWMNRGGGKWFLEINWNTRKGLDCFRNLWNNERSLSMMIFISGEDNVLNTFWLIVRWIWNGREKRR